MSSAASDETRAAVSTANDSLVARLNRVESTVRSQAIDLAGEVDAVAYLHKRLDPGPYIPPAGGWAAQYVTIAYLCDLILEGGVTGELLELGSGVSTVWLGLAARKAGTVHITSVDHDPAFAARTRRLVERQGLTGQVSVEDCPLTPHTGSGRAWYDLGPVLDRIPPIALLFVDGPPAVGDPLAREPAFDAVRSHLHAGALVALDDVDRDGEAQVVAAWTSGGDLRQVDRIGRTGLFELVPQGTDQQTPSVTGP